MDLSTTYLGLQLKNPLVPSASPLSRTLDSMKRLEDAGAAAIVMYSLFEEQIAARSGGAEPLSVATAPKASPKRSPTSRRHRSTTSAPMSTWNISTRRRSRSVSR